MSAATHPATYGFGDKKDAATQTKTLPAFCCEQGLLLHCCV